MSARAFSKFLDRFPHRVWIGTGSSWSHAEIEAWCRRRFGTIARYSPMRDGAWYFCSHGYAFKDHRAAFEFKMRWG